MKAKQLTHSHEDEGSNEHDDGLNEISPDDSRQAAGDGKQRRNGQQNADGNVQAAVTFQSHGLFYENGSGEQIGLQMNQMEHGQSTGSISLIGLPRTRLVPHDVTDRPQSHSFKAHWDVSERTESSFVFSSDEIPSGAHPGAEI